MGWAKDIVMEIPDTGFHRNEVARRYLEDLDKHGKTALALAMIDEEKKGDTPTQLRAMTLASPGSHREAVGQLAYILYSMNTSLLKALIQGQLPRLAAVPSGEVNLALQHLNQRREVQPGTYMNSICDDAGLSPTPSQWSTVCELMLTYLEANVEANEMAREIDQNIHPKLNGRPI